jgi:hypothetical protein
MEAAGGLENGGVVPFSGGKPVRDALADDGE